MEGRASRDFELEGQKTRQSMRVSALPRRPVSGLPVGPAGVAPPSASQSLTASLSGDLPDAPLDGPADVVLREVMWGLLV
ncbi:hypothetical protein [Fodinicurvata halophila]|uniref:hypothetical protein n=1 Tax=Fodinicurvata halophila TaxID=1419723 RepID=UPI0036418DBE